MESDGVLKCTWSEFLLSCFLIAHYLIKIIIMDICVQFIYIYIYIFFFLMMNSLLTKFYNNYAKIYIQHFSKQYYIKHCNIIYATLKYMYNIFQNNITWKITTLSMHRTVSLLVPIKYQVVSQKEKKKLLVFLALMLVKIRVRAFWQTT